MTDRELLELLAKNLEQMQSQLNENTEITKTILHRQDETDAKIDSLLTEIASKNKNNPLPNLIF